MTKYLLSALILCFIALGISVKSCQSIQEEKNRLRDNQRSLFSEIEFYRTKDSLSVASVEKLTLTKSELEKYNTELTRTVKDLGIKVKRLESASTTAVLTEIEITAPIIDTIIIEKMQPVPVQKFDWNDSWVSISGLIKDEQVSCRVQSVDTLVQVVHRVPKKLWFIKWGTKAIRQEIVSKNPHSKIVYTEYMELKK
jgi:hypothetical protein